MKNILVAIGLAGVLSPLFLMIGGFFRIAAGLRFKINMGAIYFIWCVLNHFRFDGVWLEGMLCISAVFIIGFMFWSVLCWGYTLSMLLCLQSTEIVQNLEQWELLYAGPLGLQALTQNRATILVWLRFAKADGNQVVLTKFGYICATVLRILSQFFGVV